MVTKLLSHFRLTARLIRDSRVSPWLKGILIVLPIVYAAVPFAVEIPDYVPVIGLLDDLLLVGLGTVIFVAVCPTAVVQEHRLRLRGGSGELQSDFEAYRHPDELRNLGIGLLMSIGVMLISGLAVGFVWLMLLMLGYGMTELRRAHLLSSAVQCTSTQLPDLYGLLQRAQARLRPVKVQLFVTQNPAMNAYTFGFREPYTVVLTSALVERLTPSELQAVIGHELGHILFSHVLLINLTSMSVTGFERLIFNSWSRSCELTADVIALHTSDWDPEPMVSALLKLTSGLRGATIDLEDFLSQVQDEQAGRAAERVELLSTHPLICKRIRRLLTMSHEVARDNTVISG